MGNFRSWIPLLISLILRLYLLINVLEPKIIAAQNYGNVGGLVSEGSCQNLAFENFLPPPYGNISNMICRAVWHTNELRYNWNGDVLTIILSAPYTTGWVGIGFSKDGKMVGSSAMVGWINKKGHARIRQYYLRGKDTSEVIEDKGELPLTDVPPSVASSGAQLYLAFQLKTTTPLHQQPILLAFGTKYPHNFHLAQHDDKTSILFDFSSGSKVIASSDNLGQLKVNHGILGVLGMGLILPAGAIIPRYFKHNDPLWYYLHSIVQVVGFGFLLATVLLGIQLYNKIKAYIPAHRGIGIFVLVLSVLQVLALFLRPQKDSKIRKYWNWYHHWFGRLALFFGALNIVLGIQAGGAGSDWKIGYGFLVGLIILAVIVLEVLAHLKRSEKSTIPTSFQMNPVE